MRKRFIVKYLPQTSKYGVYDMAGRSIHWCRSEADARGTVARCNAAEDINADLNRAIGNIGTVLTGRLTPERRAYYQKLRATLRDIRDFLPDVATLDTEANMMPDYASLPTEEE